MSRPKGSPYIYRRPGTKKWSAYIDRKRRHIGLKTEDETEALARLAVLVATPPVREMNREAPQYRHLIAGPVVYFVQAGIGGNIKIGRASNLRERLHALQTAQEKKLIVLGVVEDLHNVERQMHALFTKERIDREWFRPSLELLKFISSHTVRPR